MNILANCDTWQFFLQTIQYQAVMTFSDGFALYREIYEYVILRVQEQGSHNHSRWNDFLALWKLFFVCELSSRLFFDLRSVVITPVLFNLKIPC